MTEIMMQDYKRLQLARHFGRDYLTGQERVVISIYEIRDALPGIKMLKAWADERFPDDDITRHLGNFIISTNILHGDSIIYQRRLLANSCKAINDMLWWFDQTWECQFNHKLDEEMKWGRYSRCPTCGEPVVSIFDHLGTECDDD